MRRFGRTLVAAALATTVVTGTAGWASGTAQTPVTGPPPGAAEWRADRSLGRELPDPANASPGDVAAFFASLTDDQRRSLTARHPLVVGNLDGVPPALRYEANARSLGAAADGRRILAHDPRGRGQLAEVFGDLEHAPHIAVVVPGSDIDAGTFDRTSAMARSLYEATGRRTAVVAWAGYTTPLGIGLDAATGALAEAGARRLTRFTQGLAANGAATPALFCHSYGSVVCGLAASGAAARDIVVLGSPGMRADSAADLGTDARIWAAKSPADWISKVPNVELLGLGHGHDPADPAFGARRVPADDVPGHTGYFAPGTTSLRTFAAIAQGEAR
ncbi:alpha/beta hydrolase family protein [Streptomyces sp. FIT100]|uniref:alpha/beta hydrolase family protein n=1 Tax=Streptomyces sp. FIT100 TaxID=2837956 RepID=UPI0021C6BEEF|nr:alpha/beta hydrolase family protein [Streptomyces sp. FIT100]UUN26710.1 alpha/beta hydrolase family protein [Streptomyces sp. FIT100]